MSASLPVIRFNFYVIFVIDVYIWLMIVFHSWPCISQHCFQSYHKYYIHHYNVPLAFYTFFCPLLNHILFYQYMTHIKIIIRTHRVYHVFTNKFVRLIILNFDRPCVSVTYTTPAVIFTFLIYNKKVYTRYCFPPISCYFGWICFHEA